MTDNFMFSPNALQQEISAKAFADETEMLRILAGACPRYEKLRPSIQNEAAGLVNRLRKEGAGHGVEAFLQQYGLETQEGIAIMSLAEALLRIPDDHTADELIRDKFEGRRWDEHLGKSESLLVNASSWGLVLTGKLLDYTLPDSGKAKASAILKKLLGRLGEPTLREALRQAVKFIGTQFVMGTDISEAMKRARSAERKGYNLSYDILGEGARTQAQADGYFRAYQEAIAIIGKQKGPQMPSLSIKLSALHPRYVLAQKDRLAAELLPRLKELVRQARAANLIVSIDAEESSRLDLHMLVFQALVEDPEFRGANCIGFVMQAYQKRAFYVVDWLRDLAERTGSRLPVRLVKGAYWDTEIKLAQQNGLEGYPVFTRKSHTDLSYLACAEKLLSHPAQFYPQFATHNALTLAAVRAMAQDAGWRVGDYEFQRLHGMGEKLYDQLIGDIPCRIYAPVGAHKDLLAYLIRRLLENGANSSFVNQLMDAAIPVADILRDPLEHARGRDFLPHPDIPLPAGIYPDRVNSYGFDLGNWAYQQKMAAMLAPWRQGIWKYGAKGAVEFTQDMELAPGASTVTSPTNGSVVGYIALVQDEAAVAAIIQRANVAFPAWNDQPVEARAAILEKAASLFEQQDAELMALCVREAGKTIPDAIAEWREAVDFLRYYAAQARQVMTPQPMPGPTGESNTLHLHGRGVFACISPWNFPLAIFIGQVAAALVTGNTVVAKPAEQTPLIAARAVELLHRAGVPQDALILLPGSGRVLGQALVGNPAIAGVCFTGSVPTARIINRTLALREEGPIVPLIAETGGQNCMIVDSTALLEQAVDDALMSAFGSAGQRCSALRILLVQDEVADELLTLLREAMQELRMGDPVEFHTDIGPVIDPRAQQGLLAHIEAMKRDAKLLGVVGEVTKREQDMMSDSGQKAASALSANVESSPSRVQQDEREPLKNGTYVQPHLFEIKAISQLTEEHFGPVLHVLRFKAEEMAVLPARINATGFGLTFGLHSRIEDHWDLVQSRVRVGNCYINRNMIGAVVGVQPFGGEGLSGTGPKAGGPHYLLRFVSERTVTINTAAIGGNLELLSNPAGVAANAAKAKVA